MNLRCLFATVRVCLLATLQEKVAAAIVMKLSEQSGNGSGIMQINSTGGSTLQWSRRSTVVILALLFHKTLLGQVNLDHVVMYR